MKIVEGDMHCHSYWSDGSDKPDDIVNLAHEKGLQYLVLTDHDTVMGLKEFIPKCQLRGIEAMTGIEVSTMHKEIYFHILGYDFDLTAMSGLLRAPLPGYLEIEVIAKKILKYLSNKYRIGPIATEGIRKHFALPGQVSFMHVIDYMARHAGKTIGEIKNEIFSDDRFWTPPRHMPRPVSAVKLIARAGGVSSLAHPEAFLINRYGDLSERRKVLEELLVELKKAGLFAIEAYNGQNTAEQTAYYLSLAKKYEFHVTAGSDYHGFYKEDTDLGAKGMSFDDFQEFKRASRAARNK